MTIRRKYPTQAKPDSGMTLPELLVAMIISTVVIAIGVSLLSQTFRVAASTQTRAELWSSMTNSSIQLIRDVNDGTKIVTSEPRHLAVQVVRDGRCQTRDWQVDGDRLVSTTTFYDAPSCTGGSTERKVVAIKGNLKSFTFTYYSAASVDSELPAPVSPGVVNRVGWTMSATPTDTTAVLRLESGAAFTGRGASTDGGGATQTPLAAFLSVTTNASGIEGVSAPILSWTDATPELTQGWAVYRTSYPEGSDASSSSTGWEQIAYLRTATPAPGTMTYTDRTLPRGYTGLYVVRATVPDGYGPSSNQKATGLRPSPSSTLTTTGAPSTIELSWTAPRGATGYDIYRSETGSPAPILYRTSDDIKGSAKRSGTGDAVRWTWTDPLAAGHAHTYSVVPVNRWERLATTSSQTGSLPIGEALARAYSGTTSTTRTAPRAASPLSGAFTAPARPERAVLDLSSRSSATDYRSTVAWTPAPWVGGGPEVATDGQGHRDRGWAAERRGSAWEAVWAAETPRTTTVRTDAGTEPDITYGYRTRTVNGSGASAWAAEARILQRPAVPDSPTIALSGLTTRQATVRAATSPSATAWEIGMTTTAGSPAMRGVRDADANRRAVYDQLTHSSSNAWRSRSTNIPPTGVSGGGTSAWGATDSITTDRLRVWLSDGSKTTLSVSARLNTEGGSSASVTRSGITGVVGAETQGSYGGGQAHIFRPLPHNTSYTLTGDLTDGYNNVSDSATITTDRLSVWLSDGSATTRSVSARLHNLNGSSASLTVEGHQTQPSLGGGQLHTFGDGHPGLTHNTGYTLTARLTDGFNHVSYQDVIRTLEFLPPRVAFDSITTRSARAWADCGSAAGCAVVGPDGRELLSGSTWNQLSDDSWHDFQGVASDGWNRVTTRASARTLRLVAAPPSCSMTGGGDSPGSATISAWGGSGGYEYSPARVRTGLGPGSYGGAARSTVSDGYNSSASGWVSCGSVTVTDPYPTPWGGSAPAGCPYPGTYITPASPRTWQVRRASVATCELRWLVTAAGEAPGRPAGMVEGAGVYSVGSGASAYTRTSGESGPMGPLVGG
ncbi:prepilin-type N-terminal cleavage/methylation domain-containing protein [Sanguibacter keddieii DSM 10542]|uniref:Prepilin-type N-terminal cleavage/methylation domain-containing protein n=1 Tax=Sanguibacter keddieii (strain ATCC 51767 / DSM 10542 / NCFB 3025 / ST-74) TaxID=446469 RepID=D1BBK6_SANKS|nr:prepilin-type N-terminal cleavage/methylation domain-containing protein [Sanguibacter keddieii]ACZ22777.1 prepilin-type N-terminal cleavage/methylation domain-containing protein [Sanguibacter keddieii DSM 10542]